MCWWFSIVNGRMLSFKGKAKNGQDAAPSFATTKHSTLHAMMAEMEDQVK